MSESQDPIKMWFLLEDEEKIPAFWSRKAYKELPTSKVGWVWITPQGLFELAEMSGAVFFGNSREVYITF